MDGAQNSAVIQSLLNQGAYEQALKIAGPRLETNPDNLTAWYQVACASAHLTKSEGAITNFSHALFSLTQGGKPLWALVALQDDLVPQSRYQQLIENLIAQYASGNPTGGLTDLMAPCISRHSSPQQNVAQWNDGLSRDELNHMADSLCAVAWGQSLEQLAGNPKISYLPIFSSASPDTFRQLISALKVCHANRGDTLVKQGSRTIALQIMVAGSASGEMAIGKGSSAPCTVIDGGILGEESIVTGNAETTTFIANEPCTLLQIPETTLNSMAQHDANMARAMVMAYQQRIVFALLRHNHGLQEIDLRRRPNILRQMDPELYESGTAVHSSAANCVAGESGCLLVFSGSIAETDDVPSASGLIRTDSGPVYRRGDWIDLQRWTAAGSVPRVLRANENTVSLKLSRTAFHAIISEYPQLAEAMYPLQV
ncbi:MAG: cyclic nucleotide-binding domain-containing protein [Deltaproteobacteria bacterium]|nr:cyclic nucleotide-binding domain-containing protein [Deltaproteobacteria bacterium]